VADRALVRRRTAVSGALGGLAVAALATACDHGDDLSSRSADQSTGTSAPASPSAQSPAQTPDQALVDEVLASLTAAVAVLTHARKVPELRQPLAPLVKAHRQHVEVLEGEVPDGSSSGPARDQAAALRAVRRSEQALQTTLVDAAGAAQSGALARLLASMSASVTQHLMLLPTEGAP
jgi:hypothetical protein